MSFDQAAAVRREGGAFIGEVGAAWGQGRAAFGGLLSGMALRAMEDTLPPGRRLRSVLVDFLAPVGHGTTSIDVVVLREGKALTHAEARISQGGVVCAVVVGAWAEDRVTAVVAPGAPPPPVPGPDETPAFPYIEGITPAFTQQFDYQWTGAGLPFSGSSDTRVGGWVRPAVPARVDTALILAMVDAWPAPVLALVRGHAPASTVTWKVDLVSTPRPSTWWRFEAALIAAEGGHASITGQLWDDAGRLVAVSSQLVAEFSKG